MSAAHSDALDIDHLRGWIGREEIALDTLGEDLARRYHATLDFRGRPERARWRRA